MCGIVGFVALTNNNVVQDNIKCLKRLEYRGYDSSGISAISKGQILTVKQVGMIREIEPDAANINSNIAISHTRWATHGKPSKANAHPQTCGNVAVVHNGIIENYLELKAKLTAKGYVFQSQTDTEVINHLAADYLKQGLDLPEIGKMLLEELQGSFAIAVIFKHVDNKILCLKRHAPMVLSKPNGKTGMIASDIYALVGFSDEFYHLKDNEILILEPEKFTLYDDKQAPKTPTFTKYNINDGDVSKGSYDTFMEKEIHEQPQVLQENIKHHLRGSLPFFAGVEFDLTGFTAVQFVSCGTSYYASLIAKYWIESIARISTEVDIASEYRYKDVVFKENCLYVFISQSGETADTLAALKYTKDNIPKTSKTLALVNVQHSAIAANCDGLIKCYSGPEIGVASTKNFSCQLISLLFLAYKLANKPIEEDVLADIQSLPNKVYEILESASVASKIEEIAKTINTVDKVLYIGRNLLYGVALEGALKLKELSYIPVESIASGELKHGPLAIVDNQTLIVALDSVKILHSKTLSNIQEILAREGRLAIITDGNNQASDNSILVKIPETKTHYVLPVLYGIVVQLISYKATKLKGLNVDKPRNLAKSVTVE